MKRKQGKKKIIYIANIYTHHKIFNTFLIKKLAKNGYHVVVVSRENTKFDIKNKNIKFYNWNLSRTGTNPAKELLSLLELIKIIKKEKPDIVHNFTIKANIYGTIVTKFFSRAKIINTISGLGYVYVETNRSGFFGRLIIRTIWLLCLKLSDSVLFMNRDDKKIFSKNLEENKTDVIPGHGVDLRVFSPEKISKRKSQSLKSQIGIKRGKIVITFVGRLIRQKGVIELWQAAKKLIKEFDNVVFLIVGMRDSGNPTKITKQEIENMESERFIFLFDRSDVPEILSVSDIFVLPSYREGGPQVIIEAMAMGLPIVTTDAPGCRERIDKGVNGLLVPVKKYRELQKAIKVLVVEEKVRKMMGRKSRSLARKYYSQSILTDRVIAHYRLD